MSKSMLLENYARMITDIASENLGEEIVLLDFDILYPETKDRKKIASHNSFSPSRKKVVLISDEYFFIFFWEEFNFFKPSLINDSDDLKSFLCADLMDLEEMPIISLDKERPISLD